MGKLADWLLQHSAIGALAVLNTALGGTLRQALEGAADLEAWHVRLQVLGVQSLEVDAYLAVVTQLAQTSPIFDNRTAIEAGQWVAIRRVSSGESLIPENKCAWATEIWREAMANTPDFRLRDYDIYSLQNLFLNWLKTAEELWATKGEEDEKIALKS